MSKEPRIKVLIQGPQQQYFQSFLFLEMHFTKPTIPFSNNDILTSPI